MRFELDLKKPNPKHAPISAFTIGTSYIAGGLVPLFPYLLTNDMGHGAESFPSPRRALRCSFSAR